MAFWHKWLGSSDIPTDPVKTLEYKGYLIEALPFKEAGQWQLAGRISKDGKTHKFVRADRFTDKNEVADIALSKGQLIVDQLGEAMFTS
jgi:hypothetical protein